MAARNALQSLIKTYTVTTRWLRDINRIEAETKLMEYEIAAGPILYIDEVCEFPHFKYRPWVNTIDDEQYGTVLYRRILRRLSAPHPGPGKVAGTSPGTRQRGNLQKVLGLGPMKTAGTQGEGGNLNVRRRHQETQSLRL